MFYQNAKKIVYASENVSGGSALLEQKDLQIGLAESDLCTMKGRASIILDFGIKPHLSGLKRLKVKLPTPYGVLEVEHILLDSGEVKTSVLAPE